MPGKKLTKITGILLAVMGGVFTLLGPLVIRESYILIPTDMLGDGFFEAIAYFSLFGSPINLLTGVVAVRSCGKQRKTLLIIVLALIIIAVQVAGIVLFWLTWLGIVVTAASVILLFGALQIKKAGTAQKE